MEEEQAQGQVGRHPIPCDRLCWRPTCYVVQEEGTRKKCTLHRILLLPYHVSRETLQTTVATGAKPAPRTHSSGHPETIRLASVDSDGGHEKLEPIVVITTEKNILDPGALPFVPAASEERSSEDPPPEEVPIPLEEIALGAIKMPAAGNPGSDPPEDVQPPRTKDADLADVA